jgi:hypothetical protein
MSEQNALVSAVALCTSSSEHRCLHVVVEI